jgi:hypothetical protein
MSEVTTSLKLRAPPRIDETQVSKPLQDLFASWHEALREPFRGITADGELEQNLFSRRPGGNVAPILNAATRFLAGLSAQERGAVNFPLNINASSFMSFSARRLASMPTKRHAKR